LEFYDRPPIMKVLELCGLGRRRRRRSAGVRGIGGECCSVDCVSSAGTSTDGGEVGAVRDEEVIVRPDEYCVNGW